MKYITVWTNDLLSDSNARNNAMTSLAEGNAVHIGSSCVGHTRAAMVKQQGIDFLREQGAHEVEAPESERWLGKFFAKQ